MPDISTNTELLILKAIKYTEDNGGDPPTITQILDLIHGDERARANVYRILRKMLNVGFVDKGLMIRNAKTFLITKEGIEAIERFNKKYMNSKER